MSTFGVLVHVDPSDHHSVYFAQHLHHPPHFTAVVSASHLHCVSGNDEPAFEGGLQGFAGVLSGQVVRPLGFVEPKGQSADQSRQHSK